MHGHDDMTTQTLTSGHAPNSPGLLPGDGSLSAETLAEGPAFKLIVTDVLPAPAAAQPPAAGAGGGSRRLVLLAHLGAGLEPSSLQVQVGAGAVVVSYRVSLLAGPAVAVAAAAASRDVASGDSASEGLGGGSSAMGAAAGTHATAAEALCHKEVVILLPRGLAAGTARQGMMGEGRPDGSLGVQEPPLPRALLAPGGRLAVMAEALS